MTPTHTLDRVHTAITGYAFALGRDPVMGPIVAKILTDPAHRTNRDRQTDADRATVLSNLLVALAAAHREASP
jgi:hypothetical protein